MAKVKGCNNEKCIAHKTKITYKTTDEYCSKCGNKLVYVCKKCYKPVDKGQELCVLHQAEKAAQKAKMAKGAAGVVMGIGAGVCVVGEAAAQIIKIIKK